ncbi:DDE-type integrase/transposase/recombinase [Cereibacter changlensis]|nr:DDE-type integrase/transposase/recombinase [Cereibacter changlensis]
MVIGDETVDLVVLVVTLSWSRKRAVVGARSKDMLSWQACQTACLQRLGGVPAVLRIDNVKTAIAKGAGAWGAINETYRRYAVQLHFHLDACQPRHPHGKGEVAASATRVKRSILTARCSTASKTCSPGQMSALRNARTGSAVPPACFYAPSILGGLRHLKAHAELGNGNVQYAHVTCDLHGRLLPNDRKKLLARYVHSKYPATTGSCSNRAFQIPGP